MDAAWRRLKVFSFSSGDVLDPTDFQWYQVTVEYYIDRRDSDPFKVTTLFNVNLGNNTRTEFIDTALNALALGPGCHSDEEYPEKAVFQIQAQGQNAQGSFSASVMTDRQWAVVISKLKGVRAVIVSFLNESCTASDLIIYSKRR
jgi:hypothetical protein